MALPSAPSPSSREHFHFPRLRGRSDCLPRRCRGPVVAVLCDDWDTPRILHRLVSIFRFQPFLFYLLPINGCVAHDPASRPVSRHATPSIYLLAATPAAVTSSSHQPPFRGDLSPLPPSREQPALPLRNASAGVRPSGNTSDRLVFDLTGHATNQSAFDLMGHATDRPLNQLSIALSASLSSSLASTSILPWRPLMGRDGLPLA